MFRTFLLIIMAGLAAAAADDPWSKVASLEIGQELRIFSKGSARPLEARFAELTDESLVIIEKDTQRAIERASIQRIDARPAKAKPRVKSETKSETRPLGTGMTPGERNTSRPSQSTSSGISLEGKPDFETIYRRGAAQPKPAK
jgi:hypothetical protein